MGGANLIGGHKVHVEAIVMGAEVNVTDPKNIKQALALEQKEQWVEAINEEMHQHQLNGTFCPPKQLPLGFRATNTRFLFKTKFSQHKDQPDRYKARLVYQNNPWSGDFSPWEETFAPVVNKNTCTL